MSRIDTTSRTISSTLFTVVLASSLLIKRGECSPFPTDELPPPRLSPRASSTRESRRDSKIIIAVSVIFGVLIIILLSYKCCCAPHPHGRNCPSHPHRCNANVAGHEICGQPSKAHACTCGALEWNRQLEANREARRNKGNGNTVSATVGQFQLQAHNQNPGIAPPPYTPPANGYWIKEQRAPEPAVLRPNAEEFVGGVADGRLPSSAAEVTQSKNWGSWGR